jgi:hypothetical protein
MEYSRAGEKLIHKKTRSKNSRDTVPLALVDDIIFLAIPGKQQILAEYA